MVSRPCNKTGISLHSNITTIENSDVMVQGRVQLQLQLEFHVDNVQAQTSEHLIPLKPPWLPFSTKHRKTYARLAGYFSTSVRFHASKQKTFHNIFVAKSIKKNSNHRVMPNNQIEYKSPRRLVRYREYDANAEVTARMNAAMEDYKRLPPLLDEIGEGFFLIFLENLLNRA
ncbi:hypothetical protein VNO77_04011 [Canavalia gladiata]|uniref:Uncharacterized protein n=1 Tax=Canavalia gladiata TaxID=3824 RepID=A0AAN9MVW9_CANGL